MKNNLLVVKFKGGLGNQMFQYSLYRKFLKLGRKVAADTSWYQEYQKTFDLLEVFPEIRINAEDGKAAAHYEKLYRDRSVFDKIIQKLFPQFRYKTVEQEDLIFQKNVLKCKRGLIDGYWQTKKYWDDMEDEILENYQFQKIEDDSAKKLSALLEQETTVSVHVRRGDYLLPENQKIFGNICTDEYYQRAIAYVSERVPNVRIVYFTNDLDWVKENDTSKNAIYVGDYLPEGYPDWYDLYFMSRCTHHILANSTFSWWGAFLGKNEGNIVVAPKEWMNGKPVSDIHCSDWIKL